MGIQTLFQRARPRFRILWLGIAALASGLAGSPAFAQPSVQGEWVAPPGGYDWPLVTIDAGMLSNGKILVWEILANSAKLWNPRDGSFTDVPCVPPECDSPSLHCPGHAWLADGSLLVAGGGGAANPGNETRIFQVSAFAGPWKEAASMAYERFYPTCTTLSDGRVLTVAGTDTQPTVVNTPEIYDPQTNTWQALTDPDAQTVGIAQWYPFMFLLPDGKVFYAGGGEDVAGTETYMLDTESTPLVWSEFPPDSNSFFGGAKGAAVMYEPGKVLKCGGVREVVPDLPEEPYFEVLRATAKIETEASTPAWELLLSADLPEARKDHNLVLLPDGKILLVGGHDGTNHITDARMLDPQLQFPTWVNMADMVKLRGHHSVALLLPDATVLSAGSAPTAEIYEPPYLHSGNPRPNIGTAPQSVPYNTQFNVVLAACLGCPAAADIAKVTLLRPASVTHWFDSDQRFLKLDFDVQRIDTLKVTSPLNGNEAPPGYYMLFVVTNAGVPSKAAWIKLDPNLT